MADAPALSAQRPTLRQVLRARPWLLAPLTQPPAGQSARGKVICNCFDIAEDTIRAAFQSGESLELLQARTKCGTNCGSCVPELKRIQGSCKN